MRVQQLLNWLNDNPDIAIGDICFITNVSRSQFAYRFAAPARTFSELQKNLVAWLQRTLQIRKLEQLAPSNVRGAHQAEIGVFLIQGKLRCKGIEDTNLDVSDGYHNPSVRGPHIQLLLLLGLKGEHSFSA
jgi:hypothetical protein